MFDTAPVKIPDPSAPGRKMLDYMEPAKKIVAGDVPSRLMVAVATCKNVTLYQTPTSPTASSSSTVTL
jgi:hypothetical protein